MILIKYATIGHPAVICSNSGGIYWISMTPTTEAQVEDINMALQLEGINKQQDINQ